MFYCCQSLQYRLEGEIPFIVMLANKFPAVNCGISHIDHYGTRLMATDMTRKHN